MLRERGVVLEVADGHLRYRPGWAVPPELREELTRHKSDILRLLAYEDAVRTYELLGTHIDELTGRAVAARERGDLAGSARLFAEQRRLVEGAVLAGR
jgi:hypothetical protein